MNPDTLFSLVRKPGRYIGNELHTVKKDWDRVGLKMALAFPDLYEVGMSHQGLQILYHIVNAESDMLAERVYAPDVHFEALLRKQQESLFTLESRRALAEFDVVGFTLPYELCYTNILTILDLGQIPLYASERNRSHPIIIGGGSCSLNPEPVADFFDAILLGDGEEALVEISRTIMEARRDGLARLEILQRLTTVSGVYVPTFFKPVYGEQGELLEIRPLQEEYRQVRRRILPDLESAKTPFPPLVPLTRIVHDRFGVEVARGCTRGCRFCQAGVTYRPVRERSPQQVMKLAKQGIAAGGFDELALLSLSTGDYTCISDLLAQLMDFFAEQKVSVAMPSMRVGTLTPDMMTQIQRVRKTGFTIAPEAGTDRLRQVINKGITEEDLIATCREAFGAGWKVMKFYFMIGLPSETQADIDGIIELARKALKTAGSRGCSITVSVSIFVPKPHTPFQWEQQIPIEESRSKINYLKKKLPRRGFKLKWHDPYQSYLEGVFSRGDRLLARVLEEAWRRGARFDGWSEHFDLSIWKETAVALDVDLDSYLRSRSLTEVLPWQHLQSGMDTLFLQEENVKAFAGEYTPDCRKHGCQKCGVCDFKIIQPRVGEWLKAEDDSNKRPLAEQDPVTTEPDSLKKQECMGAIGNGRGSHSVTGSGSGEHHLYRFDYSRLDDARFLSHLELLQIFFRALARAQMKLNFSQGFNPSPKVSFSPASPVGYESKAEYLIVDLSEELEDADLALSQINRELPAGLKILTATTLDDGSVPNRILVCYQIRLAGISSQERLKDHSARIHEFLKLQSFVIERQRKGKIRSLDVRSQVSEFSLNLDKSIHLVLHHEAGMAGVKPMELLQTILDLDDSETLCARVMKLWWRECV